jgi:CBS domain-containing protein
MSSITERLAGLLDHTAPFNSLPAEQRQEIIREMTLEIYEAGELILQQGTDIHRALYIVESGLVRLYDEERNRLINMVGEGGVFGSYGLLQGGILPYEAKAIEPTVCALLSAERFQRLTKQHPEFKSYFDSDIKAYVRTIGTEMDASGAFLLFETSLRDVINRDPLVVGPDDTIQEAARRMRDTDSDTVLVAADGALMGLVTEGDLVDRIVAGGSDSSAPVSSMLERPPIALGGSDKLFEAVRVMMKHRIRRVIVTGDRRDEGEGPILGVVTAEDIAHFRGLDPVATVERMEKARSVRELSALRAASNRRLYRLYQQGVQSEALLDVVAELDDQLKVRLLHLVEEEVNADQDAPDLAWAWIAFGAPGRREEALYTTQSNGLVYEDPADEQQAERAARYFEALTARATAALEECGIRPSELGILASNEGFRQPFSSWAAAYEQWVAGSEPRATLRATPCFDLRAIYGDTQLVGRLRDAIRERVAANPRRFLAILMRGATENRPPISFFGRFELERGEGESEGLNLRQRGLDPIVDIARALALEAGYLRSTSTFDRLRHLRDNTPEVQREVTTLLEAFTTISDMHLRSQMEAAESGVTPSDFVDPNELHKSQQNLLKETFKKVDRVQSSLEKRFERAERAER